MAKKIGIISDSHKRSDIALEAIDILKSQKVDILIRRRYSGT